MAPKEQEQVICWCILLQGGNSLESCSVVFHWGGEYWEIIG